MYIHVSLVDIHFNSLSSHIQRPLKGVMTTDEAISMNEDGTGNTADLSEDVVSHATPSLGERFTRLEAFGGQGNGLDAPFGVGGGGFGIEDIENVGERDGGRTPIDDVPRTISFLGFETVEMVLPGNGLTQDHDSSTVVEPFPFRVAGLDERASGEPGADVIVEFALKGVSDQSAGLLKPSIFRFLGRSSRVVVGRRVPAAVQVRYQRADADAAVREALLDPGRRQPGSIIDADAVVVGIDGLDELQVELLPEHLDLSVVFGLATSLAHDRLSEM